MNKQLEVTYLTNTIDLLQECLVLLEGSLPEVKTKLIIAVKALEDIRDDECE